MSKYRVPIQTLVTAYVTVEAEDETEAIDKAFDKVPYLCAQCSGWGQEHSMDLGEWGTDGFTVQELTEADVTEVEE